MDRKYERIKEEATVLLEEFIKGIIRKDQKYEFKQRPYIGLFYEERDKFRVKKETS